MTKKEKWVGVTRPSNETYRRRFNEIFKKEEDELKESFEQSKKNKEERTNDIE